MHLGVTLWDCTLKSDLDTSSPSFFLLGNNAEVGISIWATGAVPVPFTIIPSGLTWKTPSELPAVQTPMAGWCREGNPEASRGATGTWMCLNHRRQNCSQATHRI